MMRGPVRRFFCGSNRGSGGCGADSRKNASAVVSARMIPADSKRKNTRQVREQAERSAPLLSFHKDIFGLRQEAFEVYELAGILVVGMLHARIYDECTQFPSVHCLEVEVLVLVSARRARKCQKNWICDDQ